MAACDCEPNAHRPTLKDQQQTGLHHCKIKKIKKKKNTQKKPGEKQEAGLFQRSVRMTRCEGAHRQFEIGSAGMGTDDD